MSQNTRQVRVSKIKTNMVLAKDVVSETGITLMTENTMLNDRNIMKLKVYDIPYVYVKEIEDLNEKTLSEPKIVNFEKPERVKIEETPEFIEFENLYDASSDRAKESLLSIGKGSNVDLGQLYKISADIMSTLRSKSDLFSFLGRLKSTDDHTYTHCVNVSLLCNLFGMWLGFKPHDIINLTTSGLLSDIGKTRVQENILNKPGALSQEEYEEVKKHTIYGYRMLEKADIPKEIKQAVLLHHEKIDGTGYPTGVKGDNIPPFAKIVAICDIYDAMTSQRSYRDPLCPFTVIKTFEQESYGSLDTEFLLVFLQNIAYTYIGSWVQLSDGREGEVVFINSNHLASPIVRVNSEFIDLTIRKDITINSLV